MNNFYIYAHYTKDNNELFYIGKGKGDRAYSKKGRNKYWKSVSDKHDYTITILIKNLQEYDAFIQEILAIKELSPKCNLTAGGYGGNTTLKYDSIKMEKFKSKCSKSKLKWWNSKDVDYKKNHCKPAATAVKKMWEEMNKLEKSVEQKRRNSFKKLKKIKCLNNKKVYNSVKEAAIDLNINGKFSHDYIRRVAKGIRTSFNNYKFIYVT